MSLFGTTSGFGTGGTSMFGSTTTDNHNPMKVPEGAPQAWVSPGSDRGKHRHSWEPPLGESSETLSSRFHRHWSTETVSPGLVSCSPWLSQSPESAEVLVKIAGSQGPAHTVEIRSSPGQGAGDTSDESLWGRRALVGRRLETRVWAFQAEHCF